MKLKSNFRLRKVADQHILISVGADAANFKGVITLNDTGAFICERMFEQTEPAELAAALADEYGIDIALAREDVDRLIAKMSDANMLEK